MRFSKPSSLSLVKGRLFGSAVTRSTGGAGFSTAGFPRAPAAGATGSPVVAADTMHAIASPSNELTARTKASAVPRQGGVRRAASSQRTLRQREDIERASLRGRVGKVLHRIHEPQRGGAV